MSNNIKEGEFYINERKKQEKCLKKDLDVIEGFTVVSRQEQKKNPSKFFIPDGADPGQTIMCEPDKIRFVRINQTNNYLTIQEVQIFDKDGNNVALQGTYSDEYELTKGFCRKTTNEGVGVGTPGSQYKGNLTVNECEEKCDTGCSAYEIQNETSTEGINPGCWTYQDPTVKGDGNKNAICRVRQRNSGTPVATMSSYYKGTNPFMAINGITSDNQAWPNSACTQSATGGWWEVDLGRPIDVKKVVIYNRPDCCQERLSGAQLILIDREHKTVLTKTLNSNRRQEFIIKSDKKNCGGPVLEKNMDDFDELRELRLEYNRMLQSFDQSWKILIEDSDRYIKASNKNNNDFANSYVRDKSSGAVGYVTSRGVWKWISNPTQGDSIQGRGECPGNWRGYKDTTADTGQLYSISSAPEGEIIKMDGQELIKGSNMLDSQTCGYAGKNVYVTKPATPSNPQYEGCVTGNPGEYQSDLGNASVAQCRQRAADKGSNVYMFGKQDGSTGTAPCYVGGSAGGIVNDTTYCYSTGKDPRFGGEIPGYTTKHKARFGRTHHTYHPPVPTYSKYTTEGANISALNKTYHITDDLQARLVVHAKRGNKESPNNYQLLNNYNSAGNDITTATSGDINEIKNLCKNTNGCAGFVYNPSTGQYWLKNENMWPKGNRQKYSGLQLYIRGTDTNFGHHRCSSTVKFSSQNDMWGSLSGGEYRQGPNMTYSSTCGLGTISNRDKTYISEMRTKLEMQLQKIYKKIIDLSGENIELNKKLLKEHSLLEKRLAKYQDTYKQIGMERNLINRDSAMNEDAELNMLSRNKMYIMWSILAVGMAFAVTKFTK